MSKIVFIVIQEGGSSTELYANAFDSMEQARVFRESCADNGSYATTPPVEVPEKMADYVDEIQQIVGQLRNLAVVET